MEESIAYAKKFLENLLSFYGLNTAVHATAEDEVIELSVPSTHMNAFLIGYNAETLRAMQYVVSSALKNLGYEFFRVNVDIADYKKIKADKLSEEAIKWIEEVKKTKEPKTLRPMNSADRRTVHKVAIEHGLRSESEGEGRDRHIVLSLDADSTEQE